mgnify:CR=1 FL=1
MKISGNSKSIADFFFYTLWKLFYNFPNFINPDINVLKLDHKINLCLFLNVSFPYIGMINIIRINIKFYLMNRLKLKPVQWWILIFTNDMRSISLSVIWQKLRLDVKPVERVSCHDIAGTSHHAITSSHQSCTPPLSASPSSLRPCHFSYLNLSAILTDHIQ